MTTQHLNREVEACGEVLERWEAEKRMWHNYLAALPSMLRTHRNWRDYCRPANTDNQGGGA